MRTRPSALASLLGLALALAPPSARPDDLSPAPSAAPAPAPAGVEGTEGETHPREVVATRLRIADIADMGFRLRLQPRLDYGDLVTTGDGRAYSSEKDLYLRRVRISVTGSALGQLRYVLTLSGDRVGQNGRANQVAVTDAAIEWRPGDFFALRVGRAKLPLTRSGLTSSARQLLVDRPLSVDAARGLFDDVNQPNLLVRSRLLGGAVAVYAAVADGWSTGAAPYASGPGAKIRRSDPLVVARVELSPPGFAESHKSDAHLGEGRHLTLGADAAVQHGIEYADAPGSEDRRLGGMDLSAHFGSLTLQVEARWWEIKSSVAARGTVQPHGVYGQAAWYVASLGVEPVVRYEAYVEDAARSDTGQTVLTLGLNAYLQRHSAKLQLAWVHRVFERAASGRLPDADHADAFQAQAQLYL